MAEELSAELDLSIKDALSSIDDLRGEIEKAIKDSSDEFESEFAKAISGVPDVVITPDVDDVEPAITGAIGDVDPAIPIEAEVDSVTPTIDAAIEAVDPTITVDADTDAAAAEMAVVGADITTTINVDADTSQALAQIAEIESAAPSDIELAVTVDTAQAQDSVSGLGDVSDDAGDSIDTASIATTALGTASSLSSGSIDTVTNAAGGLLGKLGPVGGALAGSVVALGSFTSQAVNSLGATQRLTTTMGEFSSQVENIDVGNLNTSLKQLALDTGSSGSAMRNAASDSFQMVTSFGVGKDAAAGYSAQVLSLAARAVALNPALGETGDVAGRLNSAFRSGRDKALVPYALGITATEISARAATIAHGDMRSEITQADKAMAGAALATEKLGGHLKQDIAEGAKDPILQVRTLGKEFASATTEIGKPLVAPILDTLRTALPSVKAIGTAIGELAQAGLPILTAAFAAVTPLVQAFADGLEALGPAGIQVIGVVAAIGYAIHELVSGIGLVATALEVASTIAAANPFVLIAAGIAVAVTALGLFTGGSDDASASTKQLTDAVREQNGVLDANSIKLVSKDLGDLQQGLTKAGIGADVYGKALQSATGATKSSRGELESFLKRQADGLPVNEYFIGVLQRISPELGKMAEQLVHSGNASYDLKKKIIEQTLAVAEGGKQSKIAAGFDAEGAAAKDFLKDATDASNKAIKDHHDAQFQAMGATQAATLATQQQAAADAVSVTVAKDQALATRSVGDAHAAVATELLASSAATDAASGAMYRYATGQGTAKEAVDALTAAEQGLSTALDLILGKFVDEATARVAYDTAVRGVTKSLEENGLAIGYSSEAAEKNVGAITGAVGAAESWAQALKGQGKSAEEAVVPLQLLRQQFEDLRARLAAAGEDTGFVDSMIGQVDLAISKVGAKAPEMSTAGYNVAKAGATGGTLAGIDWAALGTYLSSQGSTSVDATAAAWAASGGVVANAGKDAAQDTVGNWIGTGSSLGQGGLGGLADTYGGWVGAAIRNAQGAVDATASKSGEMRGSGQAVGQQGTSGLGSGLAPAPNVASAAVDAAASAAGLAGANMHNVGLGIGMSFSSGLGEGIRANINYVAGEAAAVVNAAVTAAHKAADNPPFPSREGQKVGYSIGYGLAVGLQEAATSVTTAAASTVDVVMRSLAANMRSVQPKTQSGGGSPIVFNIQVHGVTDPAVGRAVGRQVAQGASEGLTRRRVVIAARTS
jgi:hypothetical protein